MSKVIIIISIIHNNMMTLKNLTAENNSILNLIFWSDNFYSMFVPGLPFSYQRPLTPVTSVLLYMFKEWEIELTIFYFTPRCYCFNNESHQSTKISRRKSSHYGKCLRACPGLIRLKFNHWKWKIDWLVILLNIRC